MVPKTLLQSLQGDNLGDCKVQGVKKHPLHRIEAGCGLEPYPAPVSQAAAVICTRHDVCAPHDDGMVTESNRCAPSEGEEQHAADGDRRVVEVVAGDGVRLRCLNTVVRKWSVYAYARRIVLRSDQYVG